MYLLIDDDGRFRAVLVLRLLVEINLLLGVEFCSNPGAYLVQSPKCSGVNIVAQSHVLVWRGASVRGADDDQEPGRNLVE